MKTQLIGVFLATAVSSTAFAADTASSEKAGSVEFPPTQSAIAAGFESWGKDVLKYGGKGGQVLASEVVAWVNAEKKIDSKS